MDFHTYVSGCDVDHCVVQDFSLPFHNLDLSTPALRGRLRLEERLCAPLVPQDSSVTMLLLGAAPVLLATIRVMAAHNAVLAMAVVTRCQGCLLACLVRQALSPTARWPVLVKWCPLVS